MKRSKQIAFTANSARQVVSEKEDTCSESVKQPESERGQLSIDACRAILCSSGTKYTDEEVALIRRTLYTLAEIDYKYHTTQQNSPSKTLNKNIDHDKQKSYPLYPGVYRRAS